MVQQPTAPVYEDSGSNGMSRDLSGVYQTELVVPQRNGAVTNEAEMMTEVTNNSLGAAQQRVRKHRRMANQIIKEYKCMYCEKFYGSSAAAIMHMRKKHKEGTKQEIERKRGIRVNDVLRNQVTLPLNHYT